MKESTRKEFDRMMRGYRAKGSKTYRKKQYQRAYFALKDIFLHEALVHNRLESLGRNHIIGFWRRHQSDNQTTRMNYWYALKTVFELLGKPEPPKPKDWKLPKKVTPKSDLAEQEILE